MSGILSQAEIDALLNGGLNDSSDNVDYSNEDNLGLNSSNGNNSSLTDVEIDTLGEIGNISMGTAATTLYQMLGKKVNITTPRVEVTNLKKLAEEYPIPFVAVEVKYTEGLEGFNILVMKNEDALIITDLLMGGDGNIEGQEIDEIRLSAMSEVMNQMIGSSSTSLSQVIDKVVNIEPPNVYETSFGSEGIETLNDKDKFIKISFKMVIEDVMDSQIMQIMPLDFAKALVRSLVKEEDNMLMDNDRLAVDNIKEESQSALASQQTNTKPSISEEFTGGNRSQNANASQQQERKVSVSPLNLESFDDDTATSIEQSGNIDMLMDVPLPITIELGKSKKLIREILELHEGSIVVLDKFAGDLVDVVVNGKLIAKGEVVVIDDNYGVRITDIVSPSARFRKD